MRLEDRFDLQKAHVIEGPDDGENVDVFHLGWNAVWNCRQMRTNDSDKHTAFILFMPENGDSMFLKTDGVYLHSTRRQNPEEQHRQETRVLLL